jgi:hypothetical protein
MKADYIYKKPEHPNRIKTREAMRELYLDLWHKGYDSKIALNRVGAKFFKSYSSVVGIVKPGLITKGLTRQNLNEEVC